MRVAAGVVVIYEVVQQHVVDRFGSVVHTSVQDYIQCPYSRGGFYSGEDISSGVAVHVEHGRNNHKVGLRSGEYYSSFHFWIPFPFVLCMNSQSTIHKKQKKKRSV